MAKTRPPYSNEFRDKLLQLHRNGRTIEELVAKHLPDESRNG